METRTEKWSFQKSDSTLTTNQRDLLALFITYVDIKNQDLVEAFANDIPKLIELYKTVRHRVEIEEIVSEDKLFDEQVKGAINEIDRDE